MTYELAKQLKDAGFPQNTNFYWLNMKSGWEVFYRTDVERIDPIFPVANPTLSELIEACYQYDVQFKLESRLPISSRKDRPRWYAQAEWWELDGIKWIINAVNPTLRTLVDGKTPEEAVAKLWLELNKKND